MKLLAASFLTCFLLLSATMGTPFESCSCTASDGTCSASNSCPRGCIAVCPGQGTCRATCSGGTEVGGDDGGLFSLAMPVTMHHAGSSSKQVASELSRITGRSVVYSPYGTDDPVTLDVKKAELWDVLDALSMSGKIQIGEDDFSKLQNIRRALVAGEKVTVCIHGATVQRVVSEFAALSGRRLHVTAGNPKTIVNLTVKDVTFEEFVEQLKSQSGVEIGIK